MWKCPDCEHSCYREAAFRAHLRTHEPQVKVEDEPPKKRMKKYTKDEKKPEEDTVVISTGKVYPCMLCSCLFGIQSSFLSHLLTHSSEFPFGTEKDVVFASTTLVFLSSSKPF